MRTAFILATQRHAGDGAKAGTALRASGYRVIDPYEIPGVPPIELLEACDLVVTVTDETAVLGSEVIRQTEVLRYAERAGMRVCHIDTLVPAWRQVAA